MFKNSGFVQAAASLDAGVVNRMKQTCCFDPDGNGSDFIRRRAEVFCMRCVACRLLPGCMSGERLY